MSGHTRRNNKEYDWDHKKARQLYKNGMSVRQIAIKLGLTMTQVNTHIIDIKDQSNFETDAYLNLKEEGK